MDADSREKFEQHNTTSMSITEKELRSHEIIRELLQKTKNSVVFHNINRLSAPITPKKRSQQAHNSSALKMPINSQKFSLQNERIKTIYKELGNQTPIWVKIKQSAALQKQNRSSFKNRKEDADKVRARSVSISGLVSYNFNSVKARRRIAFDPQGTQQEMDGKVIQQHNRCSSIRSEKIHIKTNPIDANFDKEFHQAIVQCYPELTTQQYLDALIRQSRANKLVYGHRQKHFENMSKIMKIDGADQEEAQFSITQVKLPLKQAKKVKLHREKQNRSELQNFEKRRLPHRQSKILSTIRFE